MHGRVREASQLASEMMALIESIGDPTLTVGLSVWPIAAKIETGEMAEVLRLVADASSTWPRATPPKATSSSVRRWRRRWQRGLIARWALGRRGWRDDLDDAVAMARGDRSGCRMPPSSSTPTLVAIVRWGAPGRRRRAARHQRSAADRRAIR